MAQQRPHLPEFGKWEGEENVPYTIFFDKARKGRNAGKMINPNDPQEKPDMVHSIAPPTQSPSSKNKNMPEQPVGQGALRPTHQPRVSKEDNDLRQFSETPVSTDNMVHRVRGYSELSRHQHHGGRGSNSVQPMRQITGSGHGIERSPLNPHSQARTGGRGSAHPSLEVNNSYGSGHERSRWKPVIRGDESNDSHANCSLLEVSRSQNSVTGMRKILHLPIIILMFSRECERTGTTDRRREWTLCHQVRTPQYRGQMSMTLLKFAASHGVVKNGDSDFVARTR